MRDSRVEAPSKSVLTELVCQLTGFCARHAWMTILVITLSSAACVFYTCQSLKFKTDRADLIDPSAKFYKRWLQYIERFGESDDIVIVVEGEHPEKIKEALDEIGGRLSAQPELFGNVLYKIEPGALQAKGLQYLPSNVLVDGLERLDDFRPILKGNWDLIGLDGLITRLQTQLARLKSQPESEAALLHHADLLMTSMVNTLRDRNEFTNPWPEIISVPEEMRNQENQTTYLLNETGTMGFVMASAIHDKGTFEGPTVAIDAVRSHLEQVRHKCPEVRCLLTGISVLENDEMRRSMADSTTASILSFAGVAVLLFLGFRGFRHPMLGLFMLAIGMAWSFGYTTLAIGHLNILSVSFAAMLMGLGIDFAVHILSRYLELRHEGHGLIESLVLTSDSVGVGIITGAVTTSLAFFCATMTDFLGVAELGIIAGGGILLCALAAFTILPAVIAVADRGVAIVELPKPFEARLLRHTTLNHPWVVLSLSLACMGYIGYQTFDWTGAKPKPLLVYDHNLLNLQADGLESVEAQKHIFDSSQHSLLYALSIADTAEEARELKHKFEALGSVRQVQELATRLPSTPASTTKLLVQGYHTELANLPTEPPPPRTPMPAAIGQSLEKFQKYLMTRDDATSKRLVESIDTVLDDLDAKSLQEQLMFLGEFQYRMAYALLAQLQAIASASNPEPVTVDDLPAELKNRFVSADGKWLLQIYPKDQIWDMEPLERFVNDVRSVDPEATGTPLQNFEAARQIKRSYEICALYALGVILITLLLDFSQKKNLFWTFIPPLAVVAIAAFMMKTSRLEFDPGLLLFLFTGSAILLSMLLDRSAVSDSLFAMLPPVVGLGVTCGLLAMLGIPLNPANLIILPLILGIGVDNGVHIMHDFHSKPNKIYSTSPSTINAIMLTSTTTMVGFGSMMVSAHRGLYSLGAVLTIGVGSCLFLSLVTLPALLTLLSRHHGMATPGASIDRQDDQIQPNQESDANTDEAPATIPMHDAVRVA
jgi:hopanoid biosynthesis associated RND transporter like protein HpnN